MNIRNLLSIGVAATMMTSAYSSAIALCPGCPVGGPVTCQMANGSPCTATIVAPNIPQTTFQTVGPATFLPVGTGPGSTSLQPANWTGNGTHPVLGAITWSFDVSRSVPNSIIASIGEPGTFPATGDLGFHITGSVGALPNRVFHSTSPVHLHANSLTSFAPFVSETFTLVNPVQFDDQNGNPAFTLINIVLTLNG
jgi:hypothetical protein